MERGKAKRFIVGAEAEAQSVHRTCLGNQHLSLLPSKQEEAFHKSWLRYWNTASRPSSDNETNVNEEMTVNRQRRFILSLLAGIARQGRGSRERRSERREGELTQSHHRVNEQVFGLNSTAQFSFQTQLRPWSHCRRLQEGDC